jgi:hypothetical protein
LAKIKCSICSFQNFYSFESEHSLKEISSLQEEVSRQEELSRTKSKTVPCSPVPQNIWNILKHLIF